MTSIRPLTGPRALAPLLLTLLLLSTAAPAAAVTQEEKAELSKYEVPEDRLPDGWSTASVQYGEEIGQPRMYQTLEHPDTEVDVEYIVSYDPHRDLYDSLTSEVAYRGSGDTETTYFDSTEVEIAPESGDAVTATLNRVKEDDPNYDQRFLKLIRITAHRDGFTHVVESNSWVLLEDAGDPDDIVTDTLTAGVSRAASADLDRSAFGPVPTETATPETTYTPPAEVKTLEDDFHDTGDTETKESGEDGSPQGGVPGFATAAALTGLAAGLYAARRRG